MIRYDCEQGSYEWLCARVGVPTASCFDKIITPKKMELSTQAETYIAQFLAEWVLGEPIETGTSKFMDRGKEMEQEAITWYSGEFKTFVDRPGFITTDDGRIGVSPDLLVPGVRGGEIKIMGAVGHFDAMRRDDYLDHRGQIQGGMFVTDLPEWDRIYYHPKVPFVRRIKRDNDYIAKLSEALALFLERLDAAKAEGWIDHDGKRRMWEPRPIRAKMESCEFQRDDGRLCMMKPASKVGERWLCAAHAES